jgi:hypothetical protein
MAIRGWVYVLSNKAMPELLKIGYSTKDPSLRVQELNTTGLPHPFCVEYDALVVGPREVEQAVHAHLKSHHEAKEFFRVTVHTAVSAIRAVIAAQGKEIVVDQTTSSSTSQTGRAQSEIADKNRCPVCGERTSPKDSRCAKCFAMLP